MSEDTETNNSIEASSNELWLDEEFRKQYPLTAQSLKELAEQQQADLAHRQYLEVFQSLHEAVGRLSATRVLPFGQKYLQEQDMGEVTDEAEE